ncbi:MAG: hypothetical protein EOO25_03160 [Comamonadaceae bacterium]|nr:MAG: hypothetical protein EOO25_03160 [Comamonadaceae bacterium]
MAQPVNPPATASQVPSPSLLVNLRQELGRYRPFGQIDAAAIDHFLTHARQRYFAPGEILVQPADGDVPEIFFIRQGAVAGVRGLAELSGGAFRYEAGDLFPLSAAVAQRAVTPTYSAAVALGSEGRSEQTVATDQDNALILKDAVPPASVPRRWHSRGFRPHHPAQIHAIRRQRCAAQPLAGRGTPVRRNPWVGQGALAGRVNGAFRNLVRRAAPGRLGCPGRLRTAATYLAACRAAVPMLA